MSDRPPDPSSPGDPEASGLGFENFIVEHFGPNLRPGFAAPIARVGIFLCFVNRSGSNFLAECLASSGHLPRAREFFLKSNLLRHRRPGSDLSEVFEAIVSKHVVRDVFAAKLGFAQLAHFDSLGFLKAAFGESRFIFLRRRDLLAQAVSLEIASQTSQWKAGRGRSAGPKKLNYSRKRIELKMDGIRRKYGRFDRYFSEKGIKPHTIGYEELVADPSGIVSAVGEFLDRPIRFDPAKTILEKVDDPLKESWKRQFLEGS